ncbi:hypothetical protein [Paraglaciecola aestuariivivens]
MKFVLFNTLAVISGLIFGSVVNMSLISLGTKIIAAPAGVDVSTMESLAQSMHLFEPKHFIFPFLAHALGTLAGAMLAAKIAASYKLIFAMLIGLAFFAGGTSMVLSLPSPLWFNVLDLTLAYLPMAYLGYKVAKKNQPKLNLGWFDFFKQSFSQLTNISP